nr:MAG TPA: hypothetical protein [Caudoviricetes sp.]
MGFEIAFLYTIRRVRNIAALFSYGGNDITGSLFFN